MSSTPKELIFAEEALEKLAEGVKQVADIVAFTLGPEREKCWTGKELGSPLHHQ